MPAEDIYIISSGICNVLKNIKIVAIPLAQEGKEWKYREFIDESDMKPHEVLMQKSLHITDLRKFEHFGEDDLLLVGRRQALNEAFSASTSKTAWTIIASSKVECLIIPKIDFFRILSSEECDAIATKYVRYPPMEKIVSSFLVKCNWENHKIEVMDEIFRKKQRQKELKASRF